VTLTRFGPFRDLDRLAAQTPNIVAGSAPTSIHEAAAAGTEPAVAGAGSES
jgi:hypothetical protein